MTPLQQWEAFAALTLAGVVVPRAAQVIARMLAAQARDPVYAAEFRTATIAQICEHAKSYAREAGWLHDSTMRQGDTLIVSLPERR